jgi:hypothetical protein
MQETGKTWYGWPMQFFSEMMMRGPRQKFMVRVFAGLDFQVGMGIFIFLLRKSVLGQNGREAGTGTGRSYSPRKFDAMQAWRQVMLFSKKS